MVEHKEGAIVTDSRFVGVARLPPLLEILFGLIPGCRKFRERA
jgi:hypothetical protein